MNCRGNRRRGVVTRGGVALDFGPRVVGQGLQEPGDDLTTRHSSEVSRATGEQGAARQG